MRLRHADSALTPSVKNIVTAGTLTTKKQPTDMIASRISSAKVEKNNSIDKREAK